MPPKRARDPAQDAADEEARQQADELRSAILEYDQTTCLEHLQELQQKWDIERPPQTFQEVVSLALRNLGSDAQGSVDHQDAGSYGIKQIESNVRMAELEAMALCARMKELDCLTNTQEGATMLKILQVLYYSRKIVVGLFLTTISYNSDMVLDEEIENNLLGSWHLRFRWGNVEKLKDFQKLLLYLLDVCHEKRYRKQGDSIYEPLVVDGNKTYAWKRVGTIKSFIYGECQKEIEYDAFLQLTSSSRTWKLIEEHLEACADFQLPTLVKNRHYFSFRNGVYSTQEDMFYPFPRAYTVVPDTIVSAKYFDLEIEPDISMKQWDEIETPNLDSILNYQGFVLENETLQIFLTLVGRMLYKVGERDNWQVFPYLLGLAGTGKSTIVHDIIGKLYSVEDVGVLSNNSERTFGLAALHDKMLFVAGEVKRDLALEQSEFQSMVSGESMSINEKYKTAYPLERWVVPGIMAGNELPSFSDNAGSIARRLVVFRFDKKVTRGDTKLGEKIASEMGHILIKANKVYLEASETYGERNIWEILPQYFIEARDRSMATLSLVDAFIRQPFIRLDPDLFMTVREFMSAVRAFSSETGFDGPKSSQESMITSLGKFGVQMERKVMTMNGREILDDYLFGIALHQEKLAVDEFQE